MNNKGFTLTELLVVILILGMLTSLLVPNVSNLISKNEEDNLNKLKQSIILSCKNYVSDNMFILFKTCDNNKVSITLKDLVDGNYLTSSIKNPKTKEDINLDKIIEIEYNCQTEKFNIEFDIE